MKSLTKPKYAAGITLAVLFFFGLTIWFKTEVKQEVKQEVKEEMGKIGEDTAKANITDCDTVIVVSDTTYINPMDTTGQDSVFLND